MKIPAWIGPALAQMLESNCAADHPFTRERQPCDNLSVIVNDHRIPRHHRANGLGANNTAHIRSHHITQSRKRARTIGEFKPTFGNSGLRERRTYDYFSTVHLNCTEVFRMVPIVADDRPKVPQRCFCDGEKGLQHCFTFTKNLYVLVQYVVGTSGYFIVDCGREFVELMNNLSGGINDESAIEDAIGPVGQYL